MKPRLSIYPTYDCNLRCGFCLNKSKNRSNLLDLEFLADSIKKLDFSSISILGGEVSVLDEEYLKEFFKILAVYNKPISVVTNLVKTSKFLLESDFELNVSWDFALRENHDIVFNNLCHIEKPFNLHTIVTRTLLEKKASWLMEYYRIFKNLSSVSLRFFEGSHLNETITPSEYADFLYDVYKEKGNIKVSNFFENSESIKDEYIIDPYHRVYYDKGIIDRNKSICVGCSMLYGCTLVDMRLPILGDSCPVRSKFALKEK